MSEIQPSSNRDFVGPRPTPKVSAQDGAQTAQLEVDKVRSVSAVNQQAQSNQAAQVQGKTLPVVTDESEKVQEESKNQGQTVDKESLNKAVSKLNDYVQSIQRTLDFQLDEDSGQTVVRVYDKESETLIRQIPNDLALELAQKLNEEEPLLLFSAQV